MKFPSWNEFKDGLANFEHYIYDEKTKANQKIQDLKEDHPVFDEIIKRAIPFLPTPFNGIAQAIYSSFEGPKKDKVDEVLKFFEEIKSQTEEHYKNITSQLGSVLAEISDIKTLVAKNQDTLQLIKQVLISKDNTISQKLDILKKETDKIIQLHKKLESHVFQSYGLNWLPHDYFQVHGDTDEDLVKWKEGFSFELPSIKKGLEYRRKNIVDEIKSKLEAQRSLLIVGESGTSKTTILMEIISDYFDDGYEILYNWGTEIKNGDQLVKFIEDILKDGNTKVLIAVDNAYHERTAAIFYAVDQLSTYYLRINARFIITARLPEYEWFVKERLQTLDQEEYIKSIRKFAQTLSNTYLLPYFTKEEIEAFRTKYDKLLPEDEKWLKEWSLEVYNQTKGHPIMVKFYALGDRKGLRNDVEDRMRRYFVDENKKPDGEKIQTILICSLLDIANLTIEDKVLEKLGLLDLAYKLDKTAVYEYQEGLWNTIHPRWGLELFSVMYNESNKGILSLRKRLLRTALNNIFYKLREESTSFLVVQVLYNMAILKILPLDVLQSVFEMPDYLSNVLKSELYTLYIGVAYYRSNRYDEAISSIDKALEINSDFYEALDNKSIVLTNQGRYDDAIMYSDKAIKIRPNDPSAWTSKGNALARLSNYQKALACYDKAIEIDRAFFGAWYNKGHLYLTLGNYDEAIKYFDVVLSIYPSYADAWYNIGYSFINLRNYDEAIKYFDKAIELDSNHTNAYRNKALAFYYLAKYEQAIECFDRALHLAPNDAGLWLDKAGVFYALGNYDEAIKYSDEAIKINPKYDEAWYNKGVALAKLELYREAINCYDKAIGISPNHEDAWLMKGVAHENLGEYEEAVKSFDRVLLEINTVNRFAIDGKIRSLNKLKRSRKHSLKSR